MTDKFSSDNNNAQDDELEQSRAPLLEHLIELRTRLIWSIAILILASGACYAFAADLYDVLVLPFAKVAKSVRADSNFQLELIFTGPLEFFFVKLKLAFLSGLCLASPFIMYHLYRFIAPGLYNNEKQAFLPFIISVPILFLLGTAFVYFIMMPMLARFSFSQEQFNAASGAVTHLLPSVSKYLNLITSLILGFGISFQLPVILSFLGMVGLISTDTLRKGRKYAVVGILIFGAIFTPPDIVSQLLLFCPVMLLYEVAILCVRIIEKSRAKNDGDLAEL